MKQIAAGLANAGASRYIPDMAEEPDNLILRILQEMRGEIGEVRSKLGEIDEKITDLTQRVDGNTLVLNLVAGVVHDHETRIDQLESR